ncbi:hypothetical protein HX004_12655 [Myroides sp. 1354]|uniref:hypothetical protein n=1 Tax=unclassified Myroides TaxID=2642485 RepID=UPI002578F92B|nr:MULTISPECIES: hypothetical protein [unclassified Myroides]MDM1045620.1 hypothetical protein [Myroides sp. R163-1]MDM1056622.1 hypothetical protein [Myroides sp. 1354]MDM1069750.1 hypothetical protein [Myroides sp. 1372]
MPILIQQDIEIPYSKKMAIAIQFPYAIVDIHNSFDYLEELWETIVYTLSSALEEIGISILEGTTTINDDYTFITYQLVVLVIPPKVNFAFLYEILVQQGLPHQFTITTANVYNNQKIDILVQTN